MYEALNIAFRLRIQMFIKSHDPRLVIITAYDDLGWDWAGRVRLTCEVRHGGKVIFPRGQLTCALHGTSDGIAAKEMIMTLVAMHPSAGGGEGDDYYEDYTPDQLAWAEQYGESLECVKYDRYCDENGEPKREAA